MLSGPRKSFRVASDVERAPISSNLVEEVTTAVIVDASCVGLSVSSSVDGWTGTQRSHTIFSFV